LENVLKLSKWRNLPCNERFVEGIVNVRRDLSCAENLCEVFVVNAFGLEGGREGKEERRDWVWVGCEERERGGGK
jgi:hypothetical protein